MGWAASAGLSCRSAGWCRGCAGGRHLRAAETTQEKFNHSTLLTPRPPRPTALPRPAAGGPRLTAAAPLAAPSASGGGGGERAGRVAAGRSGGPPGPKGPGVARRHLRGPGEPLAPSSHAQKASRDLPGRWGAAGSGPAVRARAGRGGLPRSCHTAGAGGDRPWIGSPAQGPILGAVSALVSFISSFSKKKNQRMTGRQEGTGITFAKLGVSYRETLQRAFVPR